MRPLSPSGSWDWPRVLRANGRALTSAEVLAGVLHQAVEHRRPVPQPAAREAWGGQPGFISADVARATNTLRALGEQWSRLDSEAMLGQSNPAASPAWNVAATTAVGGPALCAPLPVEEAIGAVHRKTNRLSSKGDQLSAGRGWRHKGVSASCWRKC